MDDSDVQNYARTQKLKGKHMKSSNKQRGHKAMLWSLSRPSHPDDRALSSCACGAAFQPSNLPTFQLGALG